MSTAREAAERLLKTELGLDLNESDYEWVAAALEECAAQARKETLTFSVIWHQEQLRLIGKCVDTSPEEFVKGYTEANENALQMLAAALREEETT